MRYYFLAFLLLLLTCLPSAGWAEIRYEYPYSVEVLGAVSSPNQVYQRYASQRHITKKDIVLFGSEITIDRPLLSNGGDVIIFTDRLHMAAPIDTRIYFDHGNGFFEGDSPNDCRSIHYWLKGADTVIDSYELFYQLSDDVWDDATKSYSLTQATQFPEAPSGMTLCAIKGSPSRGTEYFPTHALDWDNLRSGNITIFTNVLTFCSSCGKFQPGWDGRKPEIPEILTSEDRPRDTTFFNARGIRGSRGGMPIWGCRYRGTDNPDRCLNPPNHYRRGAFRGGDAGNVSIYIVNNDTWLANERSKPTKDQEIRTRVGVTGGQQGAKMKLIAGCFSSLGNNLNCPKAPEGPTRKIWVTPYPEEVWPDAPLAKDGRLRLEGLNTNDALSLLSIQLAGLDGKGRLFNKQFRERVGNPDEIVQYGTALDHLSTYFFSILRGMNIEVTRMASTPHHRPNKDFHLPAVLKTLGGRLQTVPTLSLLNKDLFWHLARFKHFLHNPSLNEWMRDFGGLLRIQESNPAAVIKKLGADSDWQDLLEILGSNKVSEKAIRFNVFSEIGQHQKIEFVHRLDQLEQRLNDTLQTFSPPGIYLEELEQLDIISQHLARVKKYFRIGQFHMVGRDLTAMGEHLIALDQLNRDHKDADLHRSGYLPFLEDYVRFLGRLSLTTPVFLVGVDEFQYRLLRKRQALNQKILMAMDQFPDLLRSAILRQLDRRTPLYDPTYQRTLSQLEHFSWAFPTENLTLNHVSLPTQNCPETSLPSIRTIIRKPRGKTLKCVLSAPEDSHWTELRLRPDHFLFGGLVLYRFPPGDLPRVMNLRGLVSDREIEWDLQAPSD